jgi:hypothetical protein
MIFLPAVRSLAQHAHCALDKRSPVAAFMDIDTPLRYVTVTRPSTDELCSVSLGKYVYYSRLCYGFRASCCPSPMTAIQFAPLRIQPLQSTRDLGYNHQDFLGSIGSFKVPELKNLYLSKKKSEKPNVLFKAGI